MATITIRPPVDSEKVATEEGTAPRPWMNFFRLIARELERVATIISGLSGLGSPLVTSASTVAASASGIGAATTVSVTTLTAFATITSVDADATYSANEETLINEIKADFNINAARYDTTANEVLEIRGAYNDLAGKFDDLVAAHDALVTNQNTIVTLVNELKTDVNALAAQLNP